MIITMTDTTIEVQLLNARGELEGTFTPSPGQSLAEAAEDNGLSLPVSCCAGACFTCACRIVEGQDDVDIGMLSMPLVDIDEDQVLTCIGGLKEYIYNDGQFHKIVLQKVI